MSQILSADWVLPVDGPPIEDGAVVLDDGRIAAVGPADELGEGERFEGAAILPGFVNAHSHLEYGVYAGFGDGLAFGPWLALHIERKSRIDFDDMVDAARFGAAESLRSGVTTVGDASFSGAAALACDELGLRAVVHLEVFGDELGERYAATRERAEQAEGDLVRLGISPHAPYTCSADLYAACLALGLPVVTHLAESEAERQWATAGTGAFASLARLLVPGMDIRTLARQGLLSSSMVAAHCVTVDREEIELLVRADVAVAHCPRSNALLGCGIAPLAELREAGIRVGLGTDSPASTPSFDMFDELRAAILSARARERDPGALSATEALELATLGSARALALDTEIGSLAPGKRADLTVVSLEGSPYLPWEDAAGGVVFGGSPERVLLTMVDGIERYRKGRTEWHELIAAAHSVRSQLLATEAAARP